MQYIFIIAAFILASGNYLGHCSWLYNLHPALSGAACILTFLLRPANNTLVTHDKMTHRLLVALSTLLRGGKPPPVEEPPKKPQMELIHHEFEDFDAYKHH